MGVDMVTFGLLRPVRAPLFTCWQMLARSSTASRRIELYCAKLRSFGLADCLSAWAARKLRLVADARRPSAPLIRQRRLASLPAMRMTHLRSHLSPRLAAHQFPVSVCCFAHEHSQQAELQPEPVRWPCDACRRAHRAECPRAHFRCRQSCPRPRPTRGSTHGICAALSIYQVERTT